MVYWHLVHHVYAVAKFDYKIDQILFCKYCITLVLFPSIQVKIFTYFKMRKSKMDQSFLNLQLT